MNLVLNTNILVSALIKDSITRKVILDSNLVFYYPFPSFHELDKYKGLILKKSKISEKDYNIILLSLLRKIKVVPFHIIKPHIKKAYDIMSHIGPNDVIFIATAFAFNFPIWSDDAHFRKQHKIKILTTSGILKSLK